MSTQDEILDIPAAYHYIRELYDLNPRGTTTIRYNKRKYKVYTHMWSIIILTPNRCIECMTDYIEIHTYGDMSTKKQIPIGKFLPTSSNYITVKHILKLLIQLHQTGSCNTTVLSTADS